MIDSIPAGLLPAVDSEYRKTITLRPYRTLAGVLLAITLVASSVAAILAGPLDPESELVTGAATIGLYLGLAAVIVAAGAFAAVSAGSEYQYDTLSVTALFVPNRDRMLGAKLAVTAATALIVTLAVELVALACLLLFGHDKFEFTSNLFGVLAGGLVAAVCWSVIGSAIGLWMRSPSYAVVAILMWVFLVEPMLWVITSGFGIPGMTTILPVSATMSTVAVGSFADSDLLATPPTAFIVLLLWTVGLGARGWWLVRNTEL